MYASFMVGLRGIMNLVFALSLPGDYMKEPSGKGDDAVWAVMAMQ